MCIQLHKASLGFTDTGEKGKSKHCIHGQQKKSNGSKYGTLGILVFSQKV